MDVIFYWLGAAFFATFWIWIPLLFYSIVKAVAAEMKGEKWGRYLVFGSISLLFICAPLFH